MKRIQVVFMLLVVAAATLSAGTIFNESFSGATAGYYPVGPIAGTSFSVIAGSIDIAGTGFYGNLCVAPEAGNCVDTTGTNPRGAISATVNFSAPGAYVLSFDLMGWADVTNDQTATVQVTLGSLLGAQGPYYRDGARNPYATVVIPFVVPTGTSSATLTFTDLGGSATYAGAVLDNVNISSAVPEPGTLLLLAASALTCIAAKRLRR